MATSDQLIRRKDASARHASSPRAHSSTHAQEDDLARLEAVLGHTFKDGELLIRALTHSSLAYERATEQGTVQSTLRGTPAEAIPPSKTTEDADNEQLEFLGDAVVGLVVAELLCRRYPELQEGQLTRLRAALVSRQHLGEVAGLIRLGDYLRLGRGEERSGGRKKSAILANCMEAIIGALYIDGGLNPVRNFVHREVADPYLDNLLKQMERDSTIDDHKSALQELLQARHLGAPRYEVTSESGPDHRKRFVVEVSFPGSYELTQVASGQGASKKSAEQEAARRAYERLRAEHLPEASAEGKGKS